MKRITVGITGASGSIYAVKLIDQLIKFEVEIHLIISDTADSVMLHETGKSAMQFAAETTETIETGQLPSSLLLNDNSDLSSPVASGSFKTEGMIIIPCAMACAGRIASCSGDRLIERAADVVLKERGRLFLAVRETPFNTIHLKNLLALSEAGAVVYPASPSFYGKPGSIDEMAEAFTGRILRYFGFQTESFAEWHGYEK